MSEPYYLMYNPLTYNVLELHGSARSPLDLITFLANRDASALTGDNYAEYLGLDLEKQRPGMVETFAIESYAAHYVGNQIARQLTNGGRVIHADDRRRPVHRILAERGSKPDAVFITCMSANFPTAVAATIVLNHGQIPVIIGGVHVSTSPTDIDTYIRPHCPHPELVSQVVGAGDSKIIEELLADLASGTLKPQYHGHTMMEEGVWRHGGGVDTLPETRMDLLKRIPVVGGTIARRMKINPTSPYLGCPYSCRFCSISAIPKEERSLTFRGAEDFVEELRAFQGERVSLDNRFFFFLPDNLLLGGKTLDEILDRIIETELKINFAAQISIEVASREKLLAKLRRAGATHFFIGLESLERRNLEWIGKNILPKIDRSGLTVPEYYTQQIQKIQSHGISIHGAFILGLPFDYFHSFDDCTGREIARFCIQNHIGLQPCSLADLPGSQAFLESHEAGNWLYGARGSMGYLLGLALTDLTETNRRPPPSLKSSPLLVGCMAYDAIDMAGSTRTALTNAGYMLRRAWSSPTAAGRGSLKERMTDAGYAFASQVIVSLYRDHAVSVAFSRNGIRGGIERLYDIEEDPEVKRQFAPYVEQFREKSMTCRRPLLLTESG
jgi:radical SAM superfamily enzyme YgiQ (UPF0313 family)